MGQKVSLTETFTGSGLPVLYDDPVMSAGALVLHDLNHSAGAFTGIPANGGAIPNVAWPTANALVAGTPGQTALNSSALTNETLAAGAGSGATGSVTFPVVERTTKNGMHLARSQVSDINGKYYYFSAAPSILAYVAANPDHAYYCSIWHYVTRGATTSGAPYDGAMIVGNNTGNGLFAVQPQSGTGGVLGVGTAYARNTVGAGALLLNVTGPAFLQWAMTAHVGLTANWYFLPYIFGGTGGPFGSYHIGHSSIFYRMYFEDMTVSAAAGGYLNNGAITFQQRYTELASRDLQMYSAATANTGSFTDSTGRVFQANAKIYNDTFTNPSGFP